MKLYQITCLILIMYGSPSFSQDISGVYYLSNVMETASGIKLNPDSTFEFFFSYGALDRTGHGKWTMHGNKIILNSYGIPERGFKLIKSEKSGKQVQIKISDPNPASYSFVYARAGESNSSDFIQANEDGEILIDQHVIKTIELFFELCPESLHVYEPVRPDDNYFLFEFNPKIMEVFFKDFSLTFSNGYLKGKHPLLTEESYTYSKE